MARVSKNPEERRSEIMDAAEELFAERGFRSVAVSDIVKKVGVAQGTFYYHFESKEDLLNQAIERKLEGVIGYVSQIVRNPELNAQTKFETIMKAVLFSGIGKQNMTEHMDNNKDNELHMKMEEIFHTRFYPLLLNIIEQGMKEGRFKVTSYKEVSQIILFGIQGYMHAVYPELRDKETAIEKTKAIAEVITKVLGMEDGSFRLSIQD